MARKRKKKAVDPYLSQARTEAKLAYAPQRSALREAQLQAAADYGHSVAQEHGIRAGLTAAADAALPATKKEYATAQKTSKTFDKTINREAARLGKNDLYASVLKNEQAISGKNLASERALALQGMREFKTGARSGEAANIRGLRATYKSDTASILRQKKDVAAQQGAYTSKTYQDLLAQAAAAQLEVAKLGETIRSHTASEKTAAAAVRERERASKRAAATALKKQKLANQGKAGLSPAQKRTRERNAWSDITKISGLIKAAKPGAKWDVLHKELVTGQNPARRAWEPWKVAVAREIAKYGMVGSGSVRILHKHGVKVSGRFPVATKKSSNAQLAKAVNAAAHIFG